MIVNGEDESSATIREPAPDAVPSSVEHVEADDGREGESDEGVVTTTPWIEVFDPEQAE